MNTVFGAVWILIWSTIVLAFDVFLTWMMVRQTFAISYPSISGTVLSTEIKEVSDSDGTTYAPTIEYSYSVDGVRYAGKNYRYGTIGSSISYARSIIARFPVGTTVDVHYNPSNPSDAVLATGVEGFDLLFSLFLTPFNLVMIGSWYSAWTGRIRDSKRPFAHFRVVRSDERTHVVLNDPRLFVAGVVASGVSILLVFVFGFGGFAVSPSAGISAWIITIFAGVVGYQLARPGRGAACAITLDNFANTIEIFRSSRTMSDITIPASAIQAIQIETDEAVDSDGTTTYTPVITHLDETGNEQREVLGQWNVEAEANDLTASVCAWLDDCGVTRRAPPLHPAQENA
jgi:hypothetical protein